jgi:hypothetical protein
VKGVQTDRVASEAAPPRERAEGRADDRGFAKLLARARDDADATSSGDADAVAHEAAQDTAAIVADVRVASDAVAHVAIEDAACVGDRILHGEAIELVAAQGEHTTAPEGASTRIDVGAGIVRVPEAGAVIDAPAPTRGGAHGDVARARGGPPIAAGATTAASAAIVGVHADARADASCDPRAPARTADAREIEAAAHDGLGATRKTGALDVSSLPPSPVDAAPRVIPARGAAHDAANAGAHDAAHAGAHDAANAGAHHAANGDAASSLLAGAPEASRSTIAEPYDAILAEPRAADGHAAVDHPAPSPASVPAAARAAPAAKDHAPLVLSRAEDLAAAIEKLDPIGRGAASIEIEAPGVGAFRLHVAVHGDTLRVRIDADAHALSWFAREHDGLASAARQAVPEARSVELEMQCGGEGGSQQRPPRSETTPEDPARPHARTPARAPSPATTGPRSLVDVIA